MNNFYNNIKKKFIYLKNKIERHTNSSFFKKLDFSYLKMNPEILVAKLFVLLLIGTIIISTSFIKSNDSASMEVLNANVENNKKQNSSHIVTLLQNTNDTAMTSKNIYPVNSDLLEEIEREEKERIARQKAEEEAKKKKEQEAKGIYTAPPQTPSDGFVQYDVPLSYDWQVYTYNLCKKYGVSYEVMLGLMYAESSFDPNATSGVAYGLCQIHYCHESYAKSIGIDNYKAPEGNILLGVKFLSGHLKSQNGDYHRALICYNYGEGGAYQYCFNEGIYQTYYSQKIMKYANTLKTV